MRARPVQRRTAQASFIDGWNSAAYTLPPSELLRLTLRGSRLSRRSFLRGYIQRNKKNG